MAGSYADVPGHRFSYDRDGTVVAKFINYVQTTLSQADIEALNSDRTSYTPNLGDGDNKQFAWVFPQTRTINGLYVRGGGYLSAPASWSSDTTNGIDGSWTSISYTLSTGTLTPYYRTQITTLGTPLTGVKGIRVDANTSRYNFDDWYLYNVHLYGSITGTSSRLAIWHPTLDEEVGPAYFDWGDTVRNSGNVDIPFRVKNVSSTLQANTITVALNTISDYSSPTFLSQHSMNYNGGAYASSFAITSLAAGAISATCNLRRNIIPTAALGLYTLRIVAYADNWA